MNCHSLRLFRDVVSTHSISRAAQLNGVSQSAASQAMQELERTFKVELLDRSRRPIEPTPAGQLCFELCRDVLRRMEEFQMDLEALRSEPEGTVRVASIYSVGISEMSRLEAAFCSRYPRSRLEVNYLRPDKVYESVAGDAADLGLVSYPESTRDIEMIPWREEEMVVACGLTHPLCGSERVTPEDLSGVDFIAFDEDLPIRKGIDKYLRENQVSVRIAFQFDNIQTMKEAVALGRAVSILPKMALLREAEEGRMRAVPLTVPLTRPLGILHPRRRHLARIARVFLDFLCEPANRVPASPGRPLAMVHSAGPVDLEHS